MIGPLPPNLSNCGTISKFALSPAAAVILRPNSAMDSIRVYCSALSRVATTWRMLSTKPSRPTRLRDSGRTFAREDKRSAAAAGSEDLLMGPWRIKPPVGPTHAISVSGKRAFAKEPAALYS